MLSFYVSKSGFEKQKIIDF